MPVNPSFQYQLAEEEYRKAEGTADKLRCLQKMYALAPKHKSSENLIRWIRDTIKKYKGMAEKDKASKKGKSKYTFKKDGAATIAIVGYTNTGKSTLLKELTNADPLIAEYEFTTYKPEIATMDYHGVKIQMVEIPAVVDDFFDTVDGPTFLGFVRMSDLVIVLFRNEAERRKTLNELSYIDDVRDKVVYYNGEKNFKDILWKNLGLIKVYTKQPGKLKQHPPIALDKGATIKDMAATVHKDFVKKFRFARVWGKSAKHEGQQVHLNHVLADDDVVELHMS